MRQLFTLGFLILGFLQISTSAYARACEGGGPPPTGCTCAGDFVRCPAPDNSCPETRPEAAELINAGASPCYVWVNHCKSAIEEDPNSRYASMWCRLAESCGTDN